MNRNPKTGQFSGAALIPSLAAMQSAYPRTGTGDSLMATANALPSVREIGAATGTTAQRKYPRSASARRQDRKPKASGERSQCFSEGK
jgi:hypothetical protein